MSSCHHHDQSGLNDNMQSMLMITCKTIIEDQDDAGDEDADDYRVVMIGPVWLLLDEITRR